MTREEHLELYREHHERAKIALEIIKNSNKFDSDYWHEYKAESRLANRHLGVANAMQTREIRRRFRELGID